MHKYKYLLPKILKFTIYRRWILNVATPLCLPDCMILTFLGQSENEQNGTCSLYIILTLVLIVDQKLNCGTTS